MFNSQKRTAIKALKIQKEKLKKNDTYSDMNLKSQTIEIVNKYLGKDSIRLSIPPPRIYPNNIHKESANTKNKKEE